MYKHCIIIISVVVIVAFCTLHKRACLDLSFNSFVTALQHPRSTFYVNTDVTTFVVVDNVLCCG